MADESSVDKMMGKGKDALGKFLDDPEKVGKAKNKADSLLGKYMDPDQAAQATNALEGFLRNVADRGEDS